MYPISSKSYDDGIKKKGEVIHSGHFMISSVSEDQPDHENITQDRDSPVHHEHMKRIQHSYNIPQGSNESEDTYQIGKTPVTIDASLSRLFQCMSLAYRGGKVVSPKWKNFKGLKLTVKDKIRLNNAIWRTWHIQYVMRCTGKTPKCNQSLIQFATPLENDADFENHSRPEAVVMEGKYWKRRIETVVAEYKKWRAFFMQKLRMSDYPGLTWVSDSQNSPLKEQEFDPSNHDFNNMFNDLSDTLFSSFSQGPFQFPNPREIALRATNSDMIQPGLLQLQPTMDDIGEYESIQDLLNTRKHDPPKQNELHVPRINGALGNTNIEHPTLSNHTNNTNQYDLVQDSSIFSNQPCCSATTDPVFSSVHLSPANPTVFNPISSTTLINPKPVNLAHSTSHVHSQYQHHARQIMKAQGHNQNVTFTSNAPEKFNDSTMQMVLAKQESDHRNNNIPVMVSDIYNNQSHVYGVPKQSSSINVFQQQTSERSDAVSYFPTQRIRNEVLPQFSGNLSLLNASNQQGSSTAVSITNPPTGIVTAENLNSSIQTAYNNAMQNQTNNIGNSNVKVINFNLKELLLKKSKDSNNQPLMHGDTMLPLTQNVNSNELIRAIPNIHQPKVVASDLSPGSSNNVSERSRRKRPTPNKSWESNSSDSGIATSSEMLEVRLSKEEHPRAQTGVDNFAVSTNSKDSKMLKIQRPRSGSFSAEQKRRFNIKLGFDRLQQLVPGLINENNLKISKASVMSKATYYIKSLQSERAQMTEELKTIRQEVDCLKSAINNTQQLLPVTGVPPVIQHRLEHAKKYLFNTWVNERTKRDWKFYLFGIVIEPWFDSYHQSVSISGVNEFTHSVCTWAEKKCSLPQLRSDIVHALRVICTSTNILQEPAMLPSQIREVVSNKEQDANTGGNNIFRMGIDYPISNNIKSGV